MSTEVKIPAPQIKFEGKARLKRRSEFPIFRLATISAAAAAAAVIIAVIFWNEPAKEPQPLVAEEITIEKPEPIAEPAPQVTPPVKQAIAKKEVVVAIEEPKIEIVERRQLAVVATFEMTKVELAQEQRQVIEIEPAATEAVVPERHISMVERQLERLIEPFKPTSDDEPQGSLLETIRTAPRQIALAIAERKEKKLKGTSKN